MTLGGIMNGVYDALRQNDESAHEKTNILGFRRGRPKPAACAVTEAG